LKYRCVTHIREGGWDLVHMAEKVIKHTLEREEELMIIEEEEKR